MHVSLHGSESQGWGATQDLQYGDYVNLQRFLEKQNILHPNYRFDSKRIYKVVVRGMDKQLLHAEFEDDLKSRCLGVLKVWQIYGYFSKEPPMFLVDLAFQTDARDMMEIRTFLHMRVYRHLDTLNLLSRL